MTLTVLPQHLCSFEKWLTAKGYQTNTIKSYLLDLHQFLSSSQNLLNQELLTSFVLENTNKNNYRRHQASVAKFCQFAFDQQLINTNLFVSTKKSLNRKKTNTINQLLSDFSKYLFKQNKSQSTVKNYLLDLNQFISFCEKRELQ